MKKYLVALLAVFMLVGCSNKGSGSSDDTIIDKVPEGTEITFWHAMNGGQEKSLTELTEQFMAENKNIKVVLQNQTKYPDLQAKINATVTSPKDLPTMTQGYPNWFWSISEENMLVDLQPYMDHKTIGIADKDDIVKVFLDGAKIHDKQYGMPFNKSTEVLYYNEGMLKEYGVEVPTTMEELAAASKTIYEKSNGEVVGAGFDSLNNYYVIGMKNEGVEFNKDVDITSPQSEKVAQYYHDGIKEGYFQIANKGEYLSAVFGNGKIAMNIGSMAGESHVKKAIDGKNIEYGVAPRPSEKNLQQGTDLYMFAEASPEQRSAAFQYMKFLVSKDSQMKFALDTGYMPARTSVFNDDKYKNTTDSKIPAIIGNTLNNLFALPVVENSDPAYQSSRNIMEKILSDKNSDVKKVLEGSKAEFEATWKQ
ncbi:MAG: extracellular solute-binding protein [Erysipelothrix sp.]